MTTIETPSVIRHLWKSVLALGVLTLVLGAAVLIWPGDSIVVASVVFGVYLLVSGIAQAIVAFTVGMSPASRVLFFISGALSVVLGYFAFRDFNNGAAVWMLAIWIGVGFIFQGVTATVLAIDVPGLPARGWYIFSRDPDCDRRRGDHRLADQLHRGARDRRRGMARRRGDHRSCVGTERASHSQERGAPYRGVVGAQRRQLTHRAHGRGGTGHDNLTRPRGLAHGHVDSLRSSLASAAPGSSDKPCSLTCLTCSPA